MSYKDEQTLRDLYHEDGLSCREIGERFDVHSETIRSWMQKFGIERRSQQKASGDSVRKTHPTYGISNGYERFDSSHGGKTYTIHVHQVLACLDNDPHEVFGEGTEVHHRNGIRFDNRVENLEVMDASEHMRYHRLNENKQTTN